VPWQLTLSAMIMPLFAANRHHLAAPLAYTNQAGRIRKALDTNPSSHHYQKHLPAPLAYYINAHSQLTRDHHAPLDEDCIWRLWQTVTIWQHH